MNAVHLVIAGLLGLTVLICWIGVLGMWRMREPMQALHYLALPASLGGVVLACAVFLQDGFSQVAIKTALIAGVLLGINSVVTHATARAFRIRQLDADRSGHSDVLGFASSDIPAARR